MKRLKLLGILSFICLLLISCSTNQQDAAENGQTARYNNMSTTSLNQSVSDQAKAGLSKLEGITDINAINTNDELIVAFEVKHRKRLQLQKIQQDVQEKLNNEFPKWNVEVSTDKKLVLETEKLEKKVNRNAVSPKKLQQKADHLIKLMHEKT